MWRSFLLFLTYSGLFVTSTIATNKQWVPNTNWENPDNWASGKVPCPQQNVILGNPLTTRPLAVALSGDTVVHSLSLPVNGELIFHNNAALSFTQDTKAVFKSCPDKGDVQFVASAPKHWYNPANWREVTDSGNPVADPANSVLHLEQVPCKRDIAMFPKASAFNVKSDEKITVSNVIINGKLFTEASHLKAYYTSESGHVQFDLKSVDVSLSNHACTDPTGCVCGTDVVRHRVCSFVNRCNFDCDSPLEPDGTCCPLCGALMKITYSKDFMLREFKQKVLNMANEEDKSVKVSISRIDGDMVQVVFTDNEQGKTAQHVAGIVNTKLSDDTTVKTHKLLQSGRNQQGQRSPGSKSSLGLALGLGLSFLLVFLIVASILMWKRRIRMRSHSLSRIEENHDNVEMDEIQANEEQDSETKQTADTSPTEYTSNPLYVSSDGPEQNNFANPLYESATSIENIADTDAICTSTTET